MQQSFGLDMNRSFVNRPAIDLNKFIYIGNKILLKTDKIKILSIGRLNYIKGLYFAIEAMYLLKNMNIDFEYNIIGDGELKEELLFHRYQFNLENEINFLGIKQGQDVIDQINEAHVLLLPSLSEGIANVAIEAMACGTLVISTDVGGMSELIEDSRTGFLVNAKSSKEIADKIIFIKDNFVSCNSISKEARLKVENEFNIQTQNDIFMFEYNRILGNV